MYVYPDEVPMAAGRYLPQCAMPLDRWLVVPVMRLLPARTRAQIEAAGNITDVVVPWTRRAACRGCRAGSGFPPRAHPGATSPTYAAATGS